MSKMFGAGSRQLGLTIFFNASVANVTSPNLERSTGVAWMWVAQESGAKIRKILTSCDSHTHTHLISHEDGIHCFHILSCVTSVSQ